MIYALWHLEGGNIIGTWDSEEEALAEVRATLQALGPEDVVAWGLLAEDDDPDGDITMIAEGAALIERAQAALTAA
ncbi:MAG: hypothetical protein ACRDJH_14840 [Thermomicrobiales bacterium]